MSRRWRRRRSRYATTERSRRSGRLHAAAAPPPVPRPSVRAGPRDGTRRALAWAGGVLHARNAQRRAGLRALRRGPHRVQPQPRYVTGPPVDPLELVRTIETARILMPAAIVRLSAGRLPLSDEGQALCLVAGASSIFIGDRLLTTANPEVDQDKELLDRLGMRLREEPITALRAPLSDVRGRARTCAGAGRAPSRRRCRARRRHALPARGGRTLRRALRRPGPI